MKISKSKLFYSFIFVNILFIFLQIYKQSIFIKYTYQNQKLISEKEQLIQKKDQLTQQLFILKNPTSIKNYAVKNLKMEKTKLNQIKKI